MNSPSSILPSCSTQVMLIDMGNTACKLAILDCPNGLRDACWPTETLPSVLSIPTPRNAADFADLQQQCSLFLAKNLGRVQVAVGVAVAGLAWVEPLSAWLLDKSINIRWLQLDVDQPSIDTDYVQPARWGADRKALYLAYCHRYPAQAGCVLSLGTATTLDIVDEHHRHLGGYILPGPQTMLTAMHQQAAQLPEVGLYEQTSCALTKIPTSTKEAMSSAILLAQLGFLQQVLSIFDGRLSLKIVITGGYATWFMRGLQAPWFGNRYRHEILDQGVLQGLARWCAWLYR